VTGWVFSSFHTSESIHATFLLYYLFFIIIIMLSCLFLFLFISTVHCFPFFHIQKPFGCYPSVQLDIDTSQRILSNDNNITPDYGKSEIA
jgi:hypothetical protein